MKHRKLVWSLTATSAVLGFLITVQITNRPTAQTSTDYVDLRTQIAEQNEEHRILEQAIAKDESQIAEYQATSSSQSGMQGVLEADAQNVANAAGTSPMSGPGLVITIQDDPTLPADPQYLGTFAPQADQWLNQLVNDLFGNGAQAISINGERLVTTSSIRVVDGLDNIPVLHVNSHPVAMPYVISAVGNIDMMNASLTVSKMNDYMNLMGEDFLVKVHPGSKGVTIPAYSGPLPGVYAKEAGK